MGTPQRNTILNYFQRRPSPDVSVSSPAARSLPSTPSSGRKEGQSDKKQLLENHMSGDGDSVGNCNKGGRKRIFVLESSSEDEDTKEEAIDPGQKSLLGCLSDTPPPSKRPRKPTVRMSVSSPQPDKENREQAPSPNLKDRLSRFAAPDSKRHGPTEPVDADEGDAAEAVLPSSFPHLHFDFLDAKKIRDKDGRRPDDPDYDPSTLYVPESFLKTQTPGQRQWWQIKKDRFDTVLFFKQGSFYEMSHMDAVLAMEKCGLIFMKKQYAYCGFPEASFQRYADVLVDLGYKVGRVEQTETPDQMVVRCKHASGGKSDRIVRREVCQVISCGTKTQSSWSQFRFLTAICIRQARIGVCFVDTSVGAVHLATFDDDCSLSKLETLLSVFTPVEILHERGGKALPAALHQVLLKFQCRIGDRAGRAFPSAKKTLKMISDEDYFESSGKSPFQVWPQELVVHLDDGDLLGLTPKTSSEAVLSAMGALISYLKEALIDIYVLSMKKVVNVQPIDVDRKLDEPPANSTMILDSKTLRHLDVLPSAGNSFSLYWAVNKAHTAMGKRILHTWVCNPLMNPLDIENRQKALSYFHENAQLADRVREGVKGMPDVEKLLCQIHRAGVKVGETHPESRAVYYQQEIYSKAKISRLVSCLSNLRRMDRLMTDLRDDLSRSGLALFHNLTAQIPVDLGDKLNFFEKAFNAQEALAAGRIVPKPGVDEEYDSIQDEKQKLADDVDAYLKSQKLFFGAAVRFFGSNNDTFQLEVPELAVHKANSEYTFSSKKKGFQRFMTKHTHEFRSRNDSLEKRERMALDEVGRNVFHKFSREKKVWDKAIELVAALDGLLSLHDYSFSLSMEASCFPTLVKEWQQQPRLQIMSGQHPIVIAADPAKAFIPNDFQLDHRLAILTGANMGGKSTLMRQTALLCILAQMGCRVPALQMELSPVDRIFTRIGASDNVFDGQSTFFVELSETSSILKYASVHSLVLIDELGRGTTTFDGCAIAYGVTKNLISKRCRTIFSTHYHELTKELMAHRDIQIYHMSIVEDNEDNEENNIVFLFTVAAGPCSKSHGFNAAKLAGLPDPIIQHGKLVADNFEREQNNLLQLSRILESR